MKTTLIHKLHDFIEMSYQDQVLFKYVYVSQSPSLESPRPYFHPLRTLAGNDVSLFRPHDHLWHTGLTMCIANLSGENFWGGATYTRERQGYIQLNNNGHIQHKSWQEISCDEKVRCIEHLQWITHSNKVWLHEERQIRVNEIKPEAGYWNLDLRFSMTNVTGQPLAFGSPTTEGRPDAGYGSLFWRGPRSFLHGTIIGADGITGPESMGKRAAWLAFSGKHDGNQTQSTILFVDQPGNPQYPNKWFVRNDPYACISCSFMYDTYHILQPGGVLELTYHVMIGNGSWSRSDLDDYVATHQHAR